MFKTILIAVLVIILSIAGGFSIFNIVSQQTIDEEIQQNMVADSLKQAEIVLTEPTLLEDTQIESQTTLGFQAGNHPEGTNQFAESMLQSVSGMVTELTTTSFSVLSEDGQTTPIWMGELISEIDPVFSLNTGDSVTVTGIWNGAGDFKPQTITNESTGTVFDISQMMASGNLNPNGQTPGGQGGYGKNNQQIMDGQPQSGRGYGYMGGRN
ncbi:MAG: hypothetical protein CL609_08515 [Anaerolineaceae bacterium]|nr:hypothetical protein [Anaerolineaceae bacterium]